MFSYGKSKHKIPLRLGFAIAGWDALKDIEKKFLQNLYRTNKYWY